MHNSHSMRLTEDDVCQIAWETPFVLEGWLPGCCYPPFCSWLSGRYNREWYIRYDGIGTTF